MGPWKNKILQDLPTNEWKRIIADLYQKGCRTLAFEGGEPTLRKDLNELILFSRDLGFRTLCVTNGTQGISHIEADVVWVSIDGLKESHDKIRGKGIFDKAVKNIQKAKEKRILVLSTISRTNYQDVTNLCEFFTGQVYGLLFDFVYPARQITEQALNREEKIKVAQEIIDLKKKGYPILNSYSYLRSIATGWKCHPWVLLVLTADGKAAPGCMIEHLGEECRCEECDLACYGEISQVLEMKRDATMMADMFEGLPGIS